MEQTTVMATTRLKYILNLGICYHQMQITAEAQGFYILEFMTKDQSNNSLYSFHTIV